MLGQSIGIIALGKRLVLIEGTAASLDKQVYGSVLRDRFPDLVLVPSGGKGLISSFHAVILEVLEKTIWGVDFFMLCDRDALPATTTIADLETQSAGRLKVLGRYHLENYFLNAEVLARVFTPMEPADSWLRDSNQIEQRLREIARTHASYAVALTVSSHVRQLVGNVDIMPKACQGKNQAELVALILARAEEERTRFNRALDDEEVSSIAKSVAARIDESLSAENESWKTLIPGRPILNTFASEAGLHMSRLKQLYIREAETVTPSPFEEIINVFSSFSCVSSKNI